MNELSQALDQLVECGQALINVAAALRASFSTVPEPQATEVPAYSFTDIRKAAAERSHAGHTDAVRALITQYGADRLSGLKEEQYTAFMADLEALA